MTEKDNGRKIPRLRLIFGSALALAVVFALSLCVTAAVRFRQFASGAEPSPLSDDERVALMSLLYERYPENFGVLRNLPYSIPSPNLDVRAKSAIIVDVSNGNILYQKNADEVIPPASMTKLFAMYVVDEEVSAGNLSYDQIIPLVPESWACNMPPRSSLMFLGEGQRVTLEELLLGLSVCSGNDAAYALAYTISGNMENFVERMNLVASDLGLVNTHFVESSGYSERNTTTAREMAVFAREYLRRHPDSLARYHSVMSFTYPKEHNLAPGDSPAAQDFSQGLPRHITMPVTQHNTNPLLGRLDGCDGLKTGYIDESGYNLALTAKRGGTRFLSVTMGGPGQNSAEGQAVRVHDGTELMEWAFYSFADYDFSDYSRPYFVRNFGSSQRSFALIPVLQEKTATIPFLTGATMAENLASVEISADYPRWHKGSVLQGEVLGGIEITLAGYTIQRIPLVSDRTAKKSAWFIALADRIALLFLKA